MSWTLLAGKPVILAIVWTVVGVLVRTIQSVVLRRRIGRVRWREFASILGIAMSWAIGWAVGWVMGWSIGSAVGRSIYETPVGIAEWFTLRLQIHQDNWWMLASIVGWSIGLALVEVIEWHALRQSRSSIVQWVSFMVTVGVYGISLSLGIDLGSLVGLLIDSTIIVVVVGLLIGWTLVGAIAVSLLLWLSRRSVSAL
jgi:hypothetical protein